jgi:hypothetical protein
MRTSDQIRIPNRSPSPLGLMSRLAAAAAVLLVVAACGQAVTPPVADDLTFTGISPTSGTSETLVTANGTNISGNASVTVGDAEATAVTVFDAANNDITGQNVKTGTRITFNPPTLAPGQYDVTVSQGSGATAESVTLTGAFTYEDVDVEPGALSLTGISPNQGLNTTLVTVTGQNIAGDASVMVGGEAATNVTVFDAANNDITGEDVKTGTRITFNPPELTIGEQYEVTVSQGTGEDTESATIAFTYDEEVVVVPGDALYYINAGGPEVEAGGVTWVTDAGFVAGFGGTFANAVAIGNTDMDVIYQTERNTGAQGFFGYSIEVPEAGDYRVVLHFAEIFQGLPGTTIAFEEGSRRFDVTLEGVKVHNPIDLYLATGGQVAWAITTEHIVTVTDGFLNVFVENRTGGGKLSAIEVHAPAAAAAD